MNRRWKILLAFIAGTVFAEMAADPTDYLFFQLREKMTAEQSVAAWYFLTAGFYTALFIAAYIIARARLMTAENFLYAMVALTVVGVYLSWRVLTQENIPQTSLALLLGVPTAASLGLLYGLRKQMDA
ncbi:MAG: hypothetical protein QXY50_02805 [Candidatus Caldarchaeum sp.]